MVNTGCKPDNLNSPDTNSESVIKKYPVKKHVLSDSESVILVKINKARKTPGSHPVWMLHINYTIYEVLFGEAPEGNSASFLDQCQNLLEPQGWRPRTSF